MPSPALPYPLDRSTVFYCGLVVLLLVLVFWVELGPTLVSRRVDSDLRYAMEKRLGAAGIPIPFPQRDVNLNVSQPLSVRLTPAPDTGR